MTAGPTTAHALLLYPGMQSILADVEQAELTAGCKCFSLRLCQEPTQNALLLQATNEHWADYNGTVFLVSSDIFTFSGLLDSTAGVPALRTWAITNTSRIAEVGTSLGAEPPTKCASRPSVQWTPACLISLLAALSQPRALQRVCSPSESSLPRCQLWSISR